MNVQVRPVTDAKLTIRISRELAFKLKRQLEKEKKSRSLRILTLNSYITELIINAVKKEAKCQS